MTAWFTHGWMIYKQLEEVYYGNYSLAMYRARAPLSSLALRMRHF